MCCFGNFVAVFLLFTGHSVRGEDFIEFGKKIFCLLAYFFPYSKNSKSYNVTTGASQIQCPS